MLAWPRLADRLRNRVRGGALAFGLAFCVGLVAALGWLMLREIGNFANADADNPRWTLSQVDAEFLQFRLGLEQAGRDPRMLDALRKRFDVFYTRVTSLREGDAYASLHDNAKFNAACESVSGFLDGVVPLIDGPDAALLGALPQLRAQAAAQDARVRQISLGGLSTFADIAETRRAGAANMLVRMATVLGLIFAGLAVLSLSLLRLIRLAEERAETLRRTGARLRTIVETSHDAILVCDAAGRILEINAAGEAMFGFSQEEALGARAIDLLFPPDEHAALRRDRLAFLETGQRPAASQRRFEVMVQAAGGILPVDVSVDSAQSGRQLVHVAFFRDISRRRTTEAALTEARDRALAGEQAKAKFLAVMSHEMRTPLNGLLGTITLLRDTALDRRQTAYLDTMASSGELLLGLVNDVLDLSKFEAGKIRPERRLFDVGALVAGVVETMEGLAAGNDTALGWGWIGEPMGAALGDERRLQQVLLNLVGNALKFTKGGSVDIECELLGNPPDLTVPQVEFRIYDTGIGIASEHLEQIFQDFETLESSADRKADGTGLGLGISRRLAQLLGGEMGAQSEPGEGSVFWFRLPLTHPTEAQIAVHGQAEAHARIREEAAALEPPSGHRLSVLLVEDNKVNRFVAREMIEAEGHEVTEARNGQAGVDMAAAEQFDLIMMDISMPVMDGEQAARAIRAGRGASAATPIVAVTAHGLSEAGDRLRAAGMMENLSKPINRAELRRLLRRFSSEMDRTRENVPGPVSASHEGAALLDVEQLSDQVDALGYKVMQQLFDSFLPEMEEAINDLTAVPCDDPQRLRHAAHALAGSCANFGLQELRAALARIEAAPGTHSAHRLNELAPLWARSRAALLDWWQDRAPPQRAPPNPRKSEHPVTI
ncbi:MAG: ATP-binding protein [Celeribacter sp.]|jgi:PAS domain S-box-containing protein